MEVMDGLPGSAGDSAATSRERQQQSSSAVTPSRQKVCILTSVHRAADHRLRKQARALIDAGYEVVMVAPHERDDVIDSYRVHAVPFPSTRPQRMTRTAWQVYGAALREQAAIYHFHDPELIPIGLLLRARGRHVIYDAHEDVPRDIMLKTYIPLVPRWLLSQVAKVIEKGSAMLFDGVVVAADHMLAGFRAARRVISVRNFPDLARFQTAERTASSSEFRIVYVGALSAERGIGKLVESLALVPPDLNVKLRLFGAFDPPALLTELSRLPGWLRVSYEGSIDSDQIPQKLAEANAGVACLQPTETYIAATPTKLYEYLAAGLPVVGSNFPSYLTILEKNGCGVCVDPTDPAAIAAAITAMASDPQRAAALGERGREIAPRYSWEGEAAKLVQLYSSVLGPRHR